MAIGTRRKFVALLERYLQSEHSPRLEMAGVLGLTGLAGFLASVWLLRVGIEAMWLRYPLAAAIGYLVFLTLVWNLVRMYRAGAERALANQEDGFAGADSTRFDLPDGPDGCLDVPGDEGCAVIAAIAVVLALIVVAVYFVAAAPALFAELVLDSLLVGGLYRRLRRENEGQWFSSALRRTIWPAVLVFFFLAVAGITFANYAPGSRSIGSVLEKWRAGH